MGKRVMIAMVSVATLAGSGMAASPKTDPLARGKALFDYHCAACHGSGIGNPGETMKPGTAALAAKYGGTLPARLEDRTDLTPETVAFFVRNGATVMAPYRKTEVSDADLAAIGAYLARGKAARRR
ncbi:MAG: hypothetical protein RIS85_1416 [Pseudomonadota bacterium]